MKTHWTNPYRRKLKGCYFGMWRLENGSLLIVVSRRFRREAKALARERGLELCADYLLWEMLPVESLYVDGVGDAEWADDMIPCFSGNTIGFFGPDRTMTEAEIEYGRGGSFPFWLREMSSNGEVNELVLAWGWANEVESLLGGARRRRIRRPPARLRPRPRLDVRSGLELPADVPVPARSVATEA